MSRIDDLARPRTPWPIRLLNAAGQPVARRLGKLTPAGLLASATKRTGLSDFGDPWFREPLDVLVGALEREARLSALGYLLTREFFVRLLVTRLRIEDLIAHHPEIEDEEIRSPIFILGLPRTGTTHLHELVACHPALRSLPYWESLEPIPAGNGTSMETPDPRIRRAERGLRFQHYVMPLFRLMHEMTATSRHEEIQLLATTFSSMLFESMYQVPSYRAWYKATDQTPAYRSLRRVLQILQWLHGPKRWLLKSPQHLEQLEVLSTVFPDARIVRTHRDPVCVVASMCTMVAYGLRMHSNRIDLAEVGRTWLDRVEELLRAGIAGREHLRAGQIVEIRFDDFTAAPWSSIERVLDLAGEPLTPDVREKIEHYTNENPRDRHGRVIHRLENFGLDAAECRKRLRFYQERFGIPDE